MKIKRLSRLRVITVTLILFLTLLSGQGRASGGVVQYDADAKVLQIKRTERGAIAADVIVTMENKYLLLVRHYENKKVKSYRFSLEKDQFREIQIENRGKKRLFTDEGPFKLFETLQESLPIHEGIVRKFVVFYNKSKGNASEIDVYPTKAMILKDDLVKSINNSNEQIPFDACIYFDPYKKSYVIMKEAKGGIIIDKIEYDAFNGLEIERLYSNGSKREKTYDIKKKNELKQIEFFDGRGNNRVLDLTHSQTETAEVLYHENGTIKSFTFNRTPYSLLEKAHLRAKELSHRLFKYK